MFSSVLSINKKQRTIIYGSAVVYSVISFAAVVVYAVSDYQGQEVTKSQRKHLENGYTELEYTFPHLISSLHYCRW